MVLRLTNEEIEELLKMKDCIAVLNNGGLGIQFAAVGHLVYTLARDRGLGEEIPLDWFLQSIHP